MWTVALLVWLAGIVLISLVAGLLKRPSTVPMMLMAIVWPFALAFVVGEMVLFSLPHSLGGCSRDVATAWRLLRLSRVTVHNEPEPVTEALIEKVDPRSANTNPNHAPKGPPPISQTRPFPPQDPTLPPCVRCSEVEKRMIRHALDACPLNAPAPAAPAPTAPADTEDGA